MRSFSERLTVAAEILSKSAIYLLLKKYFHFFFRKNKAIKVLKLLIFFPHKLLTISP